MRQNFCHIILKELNLTEQQRYILIHDMIKYISFLWLWLYSLFPYLESLSVWRNVYHFGNIAMHFYGAYKQDVLYHMELVLFSLGQSLPLLNTRSLKKYMIMAHGKTLQHRSTCSRFLHCFTDNMWRKRKWLIMKLSLKIPEIYFLQCGVFFVFTGGPRTLTKIHL